MPKLKNKSRLNQKVKKTKRLKTPVAPCWKGPETDGISQSLLSRYICCQERARVQLMLGLAPVDSFRAPIEYGQMWHLAEEAFAKHGLKNGAWKKPVKLYTQELCKRYRAEQDQVVKWYNVCLTQFPLYVDYWQHHEDTKSRKPLMQEEMFRIRYTLPSKREVVLRGKFDSVDLIDGEVFLQENKTKSRIDEKTVRQQLTFDLQTMIYLIALRVMVPNKVVAGVRYNICRRPLSGGKGSIRPHQATKNKPAETDEEFYSRLGSVIKENDDYFFSRWKVGIDQNDIDKFATQCLNPLLENLYDDYVWWNHCHQTQISAYDYGYRAATFPEHRQRHYRLPYGVYNTVLEGGSGELDEYLTTGSTLGLQRTDNLFPELT